MAETSRTTRKGDDDGNDTGSDMKPELHEFYNRVKQIGNQPTDEEREQHAAEFANKQVQANNSNGHQRPAGGTVECDFPFNHGTVFSCDTRDADACCS